MTPNDGPAELCVAFLEVGARVWLSVDESCFTNDDKDVKESFESNFRTFGLLPDGFLAGCREVIK